MVHRAQELGMPAIALTDHGAVDFYVTALSGSPESAGSGLTLRIRSSP